MLLEAFVPAEAVEIFSRLGVTMAGGQHRVLHGVPGRAAQAARASKVVPTLRLLSGGGAPKPPEVFYEVQREMGVIVAHGYGMTEVPMISQGSPHDTDEQLANTEGAPVRGATIRIVLRGRHVAPRRRGGRGAGPGARWCARATPTRPRRAPPSTRTGSSAPATSAHLRPDGHVTLTGRLKDVIIRKGENISAKEVEDLLYQHPQVADVAVIGLPDRDRGERVCAVVERGARPSRRPWPSWPTTSVRPV